MPKVNPPPPSAKLVMTVTTSALSATPIKITAGSETSCEVSGTEIDLADTRDTSPKKRFAASTAENGKQSFKRLSHDATGRVRELFDIRRVWRTRRITKSLSRRLKLPAMQAA